MLSITLLSTDAVDITEMSAYIAVSLKNESWQQLSDNSLQPDRLEDTWRKLRDAIRQREMELAALKHEFAILDQARALVILRGNGTVDSPMLKQSRPRVGLKEAIHAALKSSEFGLQLNEVVDAVSAKVDEDRYASERSLQAAVQTTVRRMLGTGEVTITSEGDTRRYVLVGLSPSVCYDLSSDNGA